MEQQKKTWRIEDWDNSFNEYFHEEDGQTKFDAFCYFRKANFHNPKRRRIVEFGEKERVIVTN